MNRRGFFGLVAAGPMVAMPAFAANSDDTSALVEALASPEPVTLEARVYRVRAGALRIRQSGKRITGASKAAVVGGTVIEVIGDGPALMVEAHSVVVEGVHFKGAVVCKRNPVGFGDLDVQFTGCTFTDAKVGLTVVGRGLFLSGCWFGHNKTHVVLSFPSQSELAPAELHWQTAVGGARKFQIANCYFHHGSVASINVRSKLIHGLQVTGCHHDAVQPFVLGPLVGATVTGNTIYRLRHAGLWLTGRSEGSVITGNTFAGERGSEPMGPAIHIAGKASSMAVTGNARSCAKGPALTGAVRGCAVTGNAF